MDTTYTYLGGHLNQVHCTWNSLMRPKNVDLKHKMPWCHAFIFFPVFLLALQDQICSSEHRIAVGYGFDTRQIPPLSKGKYNKSSASLQASVYKCHCTWEEGTSKATYGIPVLPGRWEKVAGVPSEGDKRWGPRENGWDGARLGAAATVWMLSVWPLPGSSELIKGKHNWSRRRGEFTTTDSNYNIRQFVLRCYCTFPVLITNYDSITPAWQFICSCLRSGRLGDGPLISRFHSSERSARRLSSADAEDWRPCLGWDNCTWPYNNLLRKYLLNSGASAASSMLTKALQISDNGINLWPAHQTLH